MNATSIPTCLVITLSVLAVSTRAQEPAPRPWTVMVYAAVDNDAEEGFLDQCRVFGESVDPDAGMEVILLIDRSRGFSKAGGVFGEDFTDTRLYRVGRRMTRLGGGEEFPEIEAEGEFEADTASAETVLQFIRFCKREFPADNYALLFYGHANGQVLLPDDDPPGRVMGNAELSRGLAASDSVDLVIFDLCAMGGIEIAYQWRPRPDAFGSDYMLAIPSVGEPLHWDRILPRIYGPGTDIAALSPAEFGRIVVEETERGRRAKLQREIERRGVEPTEAELRVELKGTGLGMESCSLYDLSAAAAAKTAVDRLARRLHASDAEELIERLRGPKLDPSLMTYTRELESRWETRPYFDLFDLAQKIVRQPEFTLSVREAAADLAEAVDRLVVASFGMPGLGSFLPGRHGVFIVLPVGPSDAELPAGYWQKFRWYHPDQGTPGISFGAYDFCGEAAVRGNREVENWFELMDAWCDRGAGGGANGYAW